jgi:AraC-like DNA-binding protein
MRYNWRMNRSLRIILAVGALVLLVAGTTLANRGKADEHRSLLPASHEPESSADEKTDTDSSTDAISNKLLDRIVASLADQGIDTDATTVRTWAAKYGVGGAVRLLTWADASGKSPSELADMFDSNMGWGAIAHKLMDEDSALHLSPGIGQIMSNGHAHGGGSP